MDSGRRRARARASISSSGGTRVNQATNGVQLGLRANWQQFTLLVIINAFVGAMVGLERAILPLLGAHDFNQTSQTVILSFILTFGLTKAAANLFAGRMSDRVG